MMRVGPAHALSLGAWMTVNLADCGACTGLRNTPSSATSAAFTFYGNSSWKKDESCANEHSEEESDPGSGMKGCVFVNSVAWGSEVHRTCPLAAPTLLPPAPQSSALASQLSEPIAGNIGEASPIQPTAAVASRGPLGLIHGTGTEREC